MDGGAGHQVAGVSPRIRFRGGGGQLVVSEQNTAARHSHFPGDARNQSCLDGASWHRST